MSYSGPTFIAIRSGKHSSSTAYSHSQDIEKLLHLKEFEAICKTSTGSIKPVFITTVDGGPDESPRYAKVIQRNIEHFKTHDLDALFLATNAPGRSAYNRVERRMAPLSHELAGIILKHDHFGNHLDSSGRTIDEELEKKNFNHAGSLLCEMWNELLIDNHPVVATYIDPENECIIQNAEIDPILYQEHVRESQYLLQIVKCKDSSCCRPFRSSIRNLLPNRFLPPPTKVRDTEHGLEITKATDAGGKFMPLFVQLSLNVNSKYLKVK